MNRFESWSWRLFLIGNSILRHFFRWWNLQRVLGLIAITVGLAYYAIVPTPYLLIPRIIELYKDVAPELIGIGITIILIDWAVERNQDRQLKGQLILQMGSRHNDVTATAISTLRARGWVKDGSLKGIWLRDANLKRTDLRYANLKRAVLEGANLKRADLSYANLKRAILEGANLQRVVLVYANLEDADLSEADMRWANLRRAILMWANLQEVDLAESNLRRANLRWANLEGANLSRANLERADLGSANLERANLVETSLEGASLWATNLEGAVMPDGIQLKGPENPDGPTYEEWLAVQEGQVDDHVVTEITEAMAGTQEEE